MMAETEVEYLDDYRDVDQPDYIEVPIDEIEPKYIYQTDTVNRNVIFNALKEYKAYEHPEDNVLEIDVATAVRKIREAVAVVKHGRITGYIVSMTKDELSASKKALMCKHNEDAEVFQGMTPAMHAFMDVERAIPEKEYNQRKDKCRWGIRRRH